MDTSTIGEDPMEFLQIEKKTKAKPRPKRKVPEKATKKVTRTKDTITLTITVNRNTGNISEQNLYRKLNQMSQDDEIQYAAKWTLYKYFKEFLADAGIDERTKKSENTTNVRKYREKRLDTKIVEEKKETLDDLDILASMTQEGLDGEMPEKKWET